MRQIYNGIVDLFRVFFQYVGAIDPLIWICAVFFMAASPIFLIPLFIGDFAHWIIMGRSILIVRDTYIALLRNQEAKREDVEKAIAELKTRTQMTWKDYGILYALTQKIEKQKAACKPIGFGR